MAIIRAAAPGLDQKVFENLVENPLIEFSSFFSGSHENPREFAGVIFAWASRGFDDEVKKTIQVLQADYPWLRELRTNDVAWQYGPHIELFGEPDSSFVLPRLLTSLAADRGLDIHIRITKLQEGEVMDLIEKWWRESDE